MGDEDFHRNSCIGVGRAPPAGPAQIIMTKSGARCPSYQPDLRAMPRQAGCSGSAWPEHALFPQ